MALKYTPLLSCHEKLGARLSAFGGWLMPIQYEGIISEHLWTRRSVSVFDICHMGEFLVYGDPEKSNLDRIVTMNLGDMPCGKCSYGFMLNEEGGIIDDLVMYRIAPEKWMLVVNAATTDIDEQNLKKHLFKDARLENASSALGKLDLQGPVSCEAIQRLFDFQAQGLRYYHFEEVICLGEKVILSRTGYTGELGYELYIPSETILGVWNHILADSAVKPAGLGARDTLRLEMGYLLYGQDISKDTTPLEAGLDKFVDFNKDFIGKDALLKMRREKTKRLLVCFLSDSRRAPRHNYKIYSDSREVGTVTSGSFSPSLSCGIGMGYVELDCATIGTKLVLKDNTVEINATVVEKPFYSEGTARQNPAVGNVPVT
ncbi:MAG: glycine cleavage system aminomethyltransferase GcvT [Candidatus Omnitrophota bacterium]|nr:MAG: glycine cleavage system aminomethyltransferase GcvT [Candidatus Omnitrophota bacterium]